MPYKEPKIEKIYYSLNGENEKLLTSFFSSFKKGTSYNLKIRAVDLLGNETTQETNFYIAD